MYANYEHSKLYKAQPTAYAIQLSELMQAERSAGDPKYQR